VHLLNLRFADLQSELKRVCALTDERNGEVRDLIDQLSKKEQDVEKLNQRMKILQNDADEWKARNK
jgi:predicted nuclease with TOPRIM domain